MPRLLLFLPLLILGQAMAVSLTPGLAAGDHELGTTDHEPGATDQELGATDHELGATDHKLDARGHKLSATDQQLGAGDHDLGASDHELSATYQELGATDHKLSATDQQLGASDHELGATDHELGATDQELGATDHEPGATDHEPGATDWAVLSELAGLADPIPRRAPGVSCRTLLPESLPGFSRLPAQPRGLARAALALALRGAGCAPQAEAEVQELARELGTPTATALLRGLARVPGAPAPRPLALLLLRLARPGGSACGRLRTPAAGTEPPSSQEPPGVRPCRVRREEEDACSPPGEREAHQVLDWVPGVSVFYNLGTSVYFAFQGCEAVASGRALEAAEDLGYAGLAALAGGLGGPVAMGVQLGLQPGLKAGVRALLGYFTAAGEPWPVPTAHSGPVLIV